MAGIFPVGHFPKFGFFKTCKKLLVLNFGCFGFFKACEEKWQVLNFEKIGFAKTNLKRRFM